jgi:hypothetical protein
MRIILSGRDTGWTYKDEMGSDISRAGDEVLVRRV